MEIPPVVVRLDCKTKLATIFEGSGNPKVIPYVIDNVAMYNMKPKEFEDTICEVCNEMKESDRGNLRENAWDDLHGTCLPMDQVLAARHEEMSHMKGHTFVIVKRQECFDRTGRAPISTRWSDTDKSYGQWLMRVRSRFVARDFKRTGEKDREDLFCATPPLELLRKIVSLMVTKSPRDCGRVRKMLFIDVKKAHFFFI